MDYTKLRLSNKKKLGKKVPNKDCDPKNKLNVWDVYHILALKVIIGNEFEELFGFKLDDLSIIKDWENAKKDWTSDIIHRYGFVTVNLDGGTDEQCSIEFIHRTYAEFFVAEFLIQFIFDKNRGVSKEEIRKKFQLFDIIMSRDTNESYVLGFILMYLENEARKEKLTFCSEVRDLLIETIEDIHKNLSVPSSLHNFSKNLPRFKNYVVVVSCDNILSTKLWEADLERNMFHRIIPDYYCIDRNYSDITALAQHCFGSDWHEKFNKSGSKLISDDEMELYKDDGIGPIEWNGDKNFLKLCDLVDKNFEKFDRNELYINSGFDLSFIRSEKMFSPIFARMRNAVKNLCFVNVVLTSPNYKVISSGTLAYIFEEVEKTFNSDRDSIRKLLFDDFRGRRSPMIRAVHSNKADIYLTTIKFYKKYKNSSQDMKDVFVNFDASDLIVPIESGFYYEYKKLLQEVYEENIFEFAKEIEKEILQEYKFCCIHEKQLEKLKDFLLYVFRNDEFKVLEILNKIK